MLTTTTDSPQHKRILRMWNNSKDDSSSYNIHRTYKSNEDIIKIKKAKEIHLELIKCARYTNDVYGIHSLISVPTAFIFITTLGYNFVLYAQEL
ncbi:uncharacterized protein LOC118442013 [Vespa mandarinia]|uniref:uncharacterized protein LOC118442013 n=1 Tax=Vespa mandarinia TaxID=7446 RepID=UPI0016165C96|nr:uncharacterized protein LOC118442013 [Vespa mandarinia]